MTRIPTNLPNSITALRILGAVLLFFTVPCSTPFYVLLTLCGLTDVLDGAVARATGAVSPLGARLDSIADLVFYSVMLVRLLPLLWQKLPRELWLGVGGLVLLRLAAYGVAAVKYRRFAALHTWLNKLTGLLVFLLPYLLWSSLLPAYCLALEGAAGLAVLEELAIHLTRSRYRPDVRTIFRRETRKDGDTL